ncbi:MAG: hypothetical protein RBT74_13020 [Tenuifilaceae bacterium]|nr:hypothetical protein [Tenuifilaceae bacterium]
MRTLQNRTPASSQLAKTNPLAVTYHAINISLAAVIALIVLYSIAFRGNSHPIPALLTEITGEVPPSKGLSASFSEIVRGNFVEAIQLNPHGLRIFAFFLLQMFLRGLASLIVYFRRFSISTVAVTDIVISTMLFAYCFAPLIEYTLRQFSTLL